MADKPTSQKPMGPRMSHLQSEPVPISFVSPQQLAQHASGNLNFFPRPQMPTTMHQTQTSMMNSGSNNNILPTSHQTQPVPSMQTHKTAAATPSHSESSDAKTLKPLPAEPIDLATFKGFKFVTLDALQIEQRDVYDAISGTFQWEMCESQEDRCIQCVRDECKARRVFLVSSGSLGERIVPQIHNLPQVYAIYIYCANVKYHREWASKFPKVRVVCDNDDLELLPQFAVDVAQANIDWGNAFLKQGTRDKAKEKFQLAADKLNNYARNHDQVMDTEIRNKLDECK